MRIYHQAGHQTIWNLNSHIEEGTGDGILFSPVHFPKNRIENDVPPEVKQTSLFDPQFYIPDSQKNKLHSYHFFPEKLMNGFTTVDFEASAYEAAEQCLEFQIEHEFESLIIPARYFPEMITDYIEQQRAFTVDPFLYAYGRLRTEKELYLSLPLTSAMILDVEYRTNILNWVTAYPDIDGIYLLIQFDEISKQLNNFEKLNAMMAFVHDLQEAEFKVICGYCNTEGILLTALDVHGVTMGAYENTRGFSIDKFIDDDQERRGPAPRIFLPKLLNWIRWATADEIREDFPDLWERIYTPTDHAEGVIASGVPPHFSQPALYKHHFQLMAELYNELLALSVPDRITALENKIDEALTLYGEIDKRRVRFFDDNCKGGHLPIWNRVLRRLPI